MLLENRKRKTWCSVLLLLVPGAAPPKVLEMQIFMPYPDLLNQKLWRWAQRSVSFNKLQNPWSCGLRSRISFSCLMHSLLGCCELLHKMQLSSPPSSPPNPSLKGRQSPESSWNPSKTFLLSFWNSPALFWWWWSTGGVVLSQNPCLRLCFRLTRPNSHETVELTPNTHLKEPPG